MAKKVAKKVAKPKAPTRDSVHDIYRNARTLIETAQDDADKFCLRENNAAGVRVRKAAQEIMKCCKALRKDVQAVKNASKGK